MTDYTDFVIQIGPPVDGFHSVTVLQSSQGTGGSGTFPAASIEALVAGSVTGFAAGSARGITMDSATSDVQAFEPEAIGRTLHDLLFTGEISRLFDRSLGDALAKGRRLRVRLHLNVENASIAPLARLPWELMYRYERREYLVLSTQTTLVRSLDVPIMQYEQRPIAGPLRVLFVMSNPRGDLNLAAERAAIEAQLAKEAPAGGHGANRRALEAEFLENATFAGLEELLNDKEFHIIHYMGHGDFDARHQGLLLFHDGARSGRDLGQVLQHEAMTRLVTLNACRTAESSDSSGADPFAGVATALVMAGVPAVLAMQYPVSDAAAIAFSARLYSEIGRGSSLEDAVDSGRMRIKALQAQQHEWATPVLFLRETSLFAAGEKAAPEVAPSVGPVTLARAIQNFAAMSQPASASSAPLAVNVPGRTPENASPDAPKKTAASPPANKSADTSANTSANASASSADAASVPAVAPRKSRTRMASIAMAVVVVAIFLAWWLWPEAPGTVSAQPTNGFQASTLVFDNVSAEVIVDSLTLNGQDTTLTVSAGDSIEAVMHVLVKLRKIDGCTDQSYCYRRFSFGFVGETDNDFVCLDQVLMSGQDFPLVIRHSFAARRSAGPYMFFVDVWPGTTCGADWNNHNVGLPQDSTGALTVLKVR